MADGDHISARLEVKPVRPSDFEHSVDYFLAVIQRRRDEEMEAIARALQGVPRVTIVRHAGRPGYVEFRQAPPGGAQRVSEMGPVLASLEEEWRGPVLHFIRHGPVSS